MKITYMLRREDFYAINERTLKKYYKQASKETWLYIYPELNAIVVARPSKAVRKYLYTEFKVNGSPLKRILVRLYAGVMLNSFGLLASKRIKMVTDADADTLIYPCNRKYRIFNFANKQVGVVAKDGFPVGGLENEIAFRTRNVADFIPGLIEHDGNGYVERIIDGCPVARMGEETRALCNRAFEIWSSYIAPHTEHVSAENWAAEQERQAKELLDRANTVGKVVDTAAVNALLRELLAVLRSSEESVPVSLSHGDLQPGNIWLENGTNQLYIIDWESCTRRSLWYDKALLCEELRKNDGLRRYAAKRDLIHATVLLEDVVFRLVELCELPCDYGCKEFDAYVKVLLGGGRNV